MNDFLQQRVWSNPVGDYLIVFAVILLAYVLKRYAGRYASRLFFFLMKQFGREIDQPEFSRLVLVPIENFLFLLISYIALMNLRFPELLLYKFMKTDTRRLAEMIGSSIVILAFFRTLLHGIDYLAQVIEKKANLTEDQSDNQLVVFFKDFLKVLLVIIGFLALLQFAFNYNITKILAGLSLAGAALALAARESLENLIASFIIFFDKPFTTGDVVKVNTITGTVERIGLRSTRIRTTEKTYVTVPNKQMVDTIVDNLSLRTQRRAELKLELGLGTSSRQISSLQEDIRKLMQNPLVVSSNVLLSDITPEAFLVQCEYFTDAISMEEFNTLRQELNMNIIRLLEEKGIEIAGAGKDPRSRK
ncbi:MAG: mechanosensitive ion channel family protein [Chitinophagaceae bacterium]|jgi:MscS family membrane protein|nr:mechanosensitive ion channel family protein [Chitinophagaceae bacterium]